MRRLDLCRKLHSIKLKEGNSTQAHVKEVTELFDFLSVAGDTVSEEDPVVYLLASLPERYNVLVTALEANEEVPKLEVVTEQILHQERKAMDKSGTGVDHAMTSHKFYKRKPQKCLHYEKMGHIKNFCWELKKGKDNHKERKGKFHKAATMIVEDDSSSSESSGLIISHALSISTSGEQHTWIIDSGATSHMCHNKELFTTLNPLQKLTDVVLGDGRALQVIGKGKIILDMNLPNG